MAQGYCANCVKLVEDRETTGNSGLYLQRQHSMHSEGFMLCEDCFFEEEAIVEHKGTNNIPERIEKYVQNARQYPNRIGW